MPQSRILIFRNLISHCYILSRPASWISCRRNLWCSSTISRLSKAWRRKSRSWRSDSGRRALRRVYSQPIFPCRTSHGPSWQMSSAGSVHWSWVARPPRERVQTLMRLSLPPSSRTNDSGDDLSHSTSTFRDWLRTKKRSLSYPGNESALRSFGKKGARNLRGRIRPLSRLLCPGNLSSRIRPQRMFTSLQILRCSAGKGHSRAPANEPSSRRPKVSIQTCSPGITSFTSITGSVDSLVWYSVTWTAMSGNTWRWNTTVAANYMCPFIKPIG